MALSLLHGADRVVLISLDGLGQKTWTQDSAARELTALRNLSARGAVAEGGMLTAFPATTANSHAALWTGAWGDVNGITFNSHPVGPRSEHTFLARGNGFRAEGLRAEPLWVTAARQGVRAVAHQVTQGYPFLPSNTWPENLTLLNGYQTRTISPHMVLRAADVRPGTAGVWRESLPESKQPAKHFSWMVGTVILHGALIAASARYDTICIAVDPSRNRVCAGAFPPETDPPRKRPLARHFSDPLWIPEPVYFRLFDVAPDGGDFLLYQAAQQELGYFDGSRDAAKSRRRLLSETGGFLGNAPYTLLERGALGPTLFDGGDGTAERRFLEAEELLIRQMSRHQSWLWQEMNPRLFIGYYPTIDEIDHTWYGLAARGDRRAARLRQWAFAALNRGLEDFLRHLDDRDHVLVVSDHGMAGVDKTIRVNVILHEAGLLAVEEATRSVDAARSQAVYIPYNCVLVNTRDWKQGVVAREDYTNTLDRVQAALDRVRDGDRPVFTAFYRTAADVERFGWNGPTSPDLCFDVQPGYEAHGELSGSVVSARRPRGVHGFSPLREDMRAILLGGGPALRGRRLRDARAIDVAPLICRLLGIGVPKNSAGRVPLIE